MVKKPPISTPSLARKSLRLDNGLIAVQVDPALGGRIMEYALGGKNFLWVNPELACQPPPPGGLAPDGGWLNYGGDKLWPAPQGWDNARQWPGPPDAVLDGLPHALRKLSATAFRLTSGKDPLSGVQFSRVVRIFPETTRVSFTATMKNIDTKPRRWGIWAHTQLNAALPNGQPNRRMQACCPLNPRSHFPQGYAVIFGAKDNPSFQREGNLMRVRYRCKVGKIGLDSPAGWVATMDGTTGHVFVQRFVYAPDKKYPDGSSVEFWLNGQGKIHAYNKEITMRPKPPENPYIFESEVLGPFARLEPGESTTWQYDWYACTVSGLRVVDCTEAGVIVKPLRVSIHAGRVRLRGSFGVFAPGTLEARFFDAKGKPISVTTLDHSVSPLRPVLLDTILPHTRTTTSVALHVQDAAGTKELAPKTAFTRSGNPRISDG